MFFALTWSVTASSSSTVILAFQSISHAPWWLSGAAVPSTKGRRSLIPGHGGCILLGSCCINAPVRRLRRSLRNLRLKYLRNGAPRDYIVLLAHEIPQNSTERLHNELVATIPCYLSELSTCSCDTCTRVIHGEMRSVCISVSVQAGLMQHISSYLRTISKQQQKNSMSIVT